MADFVIIGILSIFNEQLEKCGVDYFDYYRHTFRC